MSKASKSVSLLLVGRDGNGKSSTGNSILAVCKSSSGNSILGDKKHFNPTSSSSSAGLEIKQASATVGHDREVTVTEIAGLEYPGPDYTGNFKDTLNKIEETIEKNQQGFNAIIFVLKYGTRFTKQEKDALLMIKSIFGFNVLHEFGVIVMTCGDSFELDVEEDKQNFEEWCRAQTGDVKDLFEDCDYRCVLFNNRTKDAVKMEEQQEKLFSLVACILQSYTLNEYNAAVKGQTEILVQTKLPQLEKEKNKTVGEVWNDLTKIDQELFPSCNIVELSTALNNVKKTLLHLKEYLKNKDEQTGVLKHLFYDISIAEMKLGIAKQRLQVMISSGAWDIVFVNGSFNMKNITETVSIRKCSLDGDGQFSSSSVSEKDVSRCGIDLLEICKTTLESQQAAEVVQDRGHGVQLQDNPQTSAVLDHTVHDKPDDDLENTKITFETISTILKQYNYTNALCLISKYKHKLTKQEIETVIKMIKGTYDTNRVKNQIILILTCDNDNLEAENDQMFKDWCQEITGSNKRLLDLCGERCVLLNPWTKDERAFASQKTKLLDYVAGLDTSNASKNDEIDFNNFVTDTKSTNPEPEKKLRELSSWASSKVSSLTSLLPNVFFRKS